MSKSSRSDFGGEIYARFKTFHARIIVAKKFDSMTLTVVLVANIEKDNTETKNLDRNT